MPNIVHSFFTFLGNQFKSVPKAATRPVMDYLAKMVTDANGILDIQTGALKSGATAAVEGVLKTLGNTLSDEEIPSADSVFPESGKKKVNPAETYLSYELAMKLLNSSDTSLKALKQISNKLGNYRNQSVEFAENFFKAVKNYSKLFSIFVNDKRFLIFSAGSPSFKKVLGVRKDMKACLKEMEKCLKKYVSYGYTFKNISDKLNEEELGLSELATGTNMKRALALTMFWKVCNRLEGYEDYLRGLKSSQADVGDGEKKDIYTLLDADPDLDERINKSLKDGLRLTAGVDLGVVGTFGRKRYEDFFKEFIDKPTVPGGNSGALGWKQCNSLASEVLATFSGKSISAQKMNIRYPLWGDYAEQLLDCVKYTLLHLNDVIYLGSSSKNKDELQVSDEGKISVGGASFDVVKLVGEKSGDTMQKQVARKRRLMKKINEETVVEALEEYHKCEKLYSKISKSYRSEESLKDACVDLPSLASESSEKQYNLKEHWEELENLRRKMREDKENKDLSLQMQRRTQRFIKAYGVWNKTFSENKRVAKKKEAANKVWAKELIKEAEAHHKSLMKKYSENKAAKESIDLIYKAIPNDASKFIQNGGYENNKKRVDEFLKQEKF